MEENPLKISSDEITVEVTDRETGKIYRRTLPVDYLETANGLRLRGEDLSGRPCELVFYSQQGLTHLRDFTGGGADHDPRG